MNDLSPQKKSLAIIKNLWRLVVCCAMGGVSAAYSQVFPVKPITLVVPYQAGGSSDAIARTMARLVGKDLGHQVIVENKAGAEGMIGSLDVMKSAPDGYRVLFGGAGSMIVVPALRRTPPFDPGTQFTPISGVIDFSFFLYAHPELPVKNLKEFVEYARAHPGKINYATGNNQGLLTFAYLKKSLNLDVVQVAYKGETAATADLLSGRVQAMFATTAPLMHAKEGRLKVLVTTLPQRTPLLPEVATMTESGYPEFPFSPAGGWLGIFGPAEMNPEVVKVLHQSFGKALTDPEVQKQLAQAGLSYRAMGLEQMGVFVKGQRDQFHHLIRDLGIPLLD
ncbi:PBP2_Bug_TTT domain containing protein [Burkholderiaceae bacterium]|jgi:tripartite-type tricarboxylate transporter receptor subunit TctC